MNLLPLYTSEQAKLTPLMDKLALAYNNKAWEIKNALFDGKNMEVLKELRDWALSHHKWQLKLKLGIIPLTNTPPITWLKYKNRETPKEIFVFANFFFVIFAK